MLVIVLAGLLVAYALRYVVRTLLRLTKLDRLSDEAGASRVLRMAALPSMSELLSRSIFWISLLGFILVGNQRVEYCGLAGAGLAIPALVAGNRDRDGDFVFRPGHRELSCPERRCWRR